MAALTGLALAMARIPAYEPPRCAVVAALRLVARAALSPLVVAWRADDVEQVQLAMPLAAQRELQQAASLLRAVRSFEGDMRMFEGIAEAATQRAALGMRRCGAAAQPTVMPLCHLCDQHCYRGIAHVLNGGGASFGARFELVFEHVTGANPRRADLRGFEQRAEVARVRFAQECVLHFVTRQPRTQLPRPPPGEAAAETLVVALPLDLGVLAAAVGPVRLKVREGGVSEGGGSEGGRKGGGGGRGREREVLVMLGVRAPEDEVVMLPPARATRDLFGSLSGAERAEAIHQLRSSRGPLPARSPLLPPGSHTASYHEGEGWQLDGEVWSAVAARGCELHLPLVAAPAWAAGGALDLTSPLLGNDAALREALAASGDGVVPQAQAAHASPSPPPAPFTFTLILTLTLALASNPITLTLALALTSNPNL